MTETKPNDFSLFWENRSQEARQNLKAPHLNLVATFETVTHAELTFEGMNELTRYAKVLMPKSIEKAPVVFQFHGYPGSARSYFELSSFVAAGYVVVAFECPGQGGKGEVAGSVGPTVSGHLIAGLNGEAKEMYYVTVYQDIIRLVEAVKTLPFIDLSELYANGASQGGALALVCSALNPDIKRCVALYPFLTDFEYVWTHHHDTVAYEGLRYYSKWFNTDDSNHHAFFSKLGYIDVLNFASLIHIPVLLGTGLSDEICPPPTQFHLYEALNEPKKQLIFPDYGHVEIGAFDDQIIDFLQGGGSHEF